MKREATKHIRIALHNSAIAFMKDYESNPNWTIGVDVFPRIETYATSAGQDIDKSGDAKPVDMVVDIVTNSRNDIQALTIAELWQQWLIDNPLVISNFNIDMIVLEEVRSIEELGDDNKTINRVIMNYEFTLTQIS